MTELVAMKDEPHMLSTSVQTLQHAAALNVLKYNGGKQEYLVMMAIINFACHLSWKIKLP